MAAKKKTTKAKADKEAIQVSAPTPEPVLDNRAQVNSHLNRQLRAKESKQAEVVRTLRGQEKVGVMFSPFYEPYLGKNVCISVNGIPVYVPVDGRTYKIPKAHAAEAHRKRISIDKMIKKTQQFADVKGNFESFAGELKI